MSFIRFSSLVLTAAIIVHSLEQCHFRDEVSMLQVGAGLARVQGPAAQRGAARVATSQKLLQLDESEAPAAESHTRQVSIAESAPADEAEVQDEAEAVSYSIEGGLCRNRNAEGLWDDSVHGAYCVKAETASEDCRNACRDRDNCKAAGWTSAGCDESLIMDQDSMFAVNVSSGEYVELEKKGRCPGTNGRNPDPLVESLLGDTGNDPAKVPGADFAPYCYLFVDKPGIEKGDCPEGFTGYAYRYAGNRSSSANSTNSSGPNATAGPNMTAEFLAEDPEPVKYFGRPMGTFDEPNSFCFVKHSCDDFGFVDGKAVPGPVIYEQINVSNTEDCSSLCFSKNAGWFQLQTRSPARCWCKTGIVEAQATNQSHRTYGKTLPLARIKSCSASRSREQWQPNPYGVEYPDSEVWKPTQDDSNATYMIDRDEEEQKVLDTGSWVSELQAEEQLE
jgi:hypothetical protein